MNLPALLELTEFGASEWKNYLEKIYKIFIDEVEKGKLSFLNLPITCPYSPPFENKHFSFWHLISEKNETGREEDRVPDFKRCARISWIAYVIKNANDKEKIWCWEKTVRTKRGNSSHIHLYLHEEHYMLILRRKSNRLELVTTFIVENPSGREKERRNNPDPR